MEDNRKPQLEFKSVSIDNISEEENNELVIDGYGSWFGNVDSSDDIIQKGAFTKTLQENEGRIAFCYQHDIYNPIGKIEEIKEDDKGLYVKVRISDAEDDIKTKIREGILKEMSIGFNTIKSMYDEVTEIRTIIEVKLWEVSLVTIACNSMTVITGMKSIEHRDSIIELVEKMFAIEQNRNKKFELLKLKSLIQSMPIESHRVVEPTIVEETKNDKLDINKLKFL
jgi:HK97 family phage prohead protease